MNGYIEEIPWPKNMPKRMAKSAKRLDIYNKKEEKLMCFFAMEQEKMETIAKMAEINGDITEKELDTVLTKLGL